MIGARVLDRYVTREFVRLFTLFVFSAPMLFILGDVTDNIDTYMDRGLTLRAVGLGYVYQFPLFMLYSFPIAALIATIFTVSNMTRHSEMSAAKAGGISFYRVLAPLPLLGIVLTFVGMGLSEIAPIGEQARARVHHEKRGQRAARTDFVYRAREGHTYSIRLLDVERNRINGLMLQRQGDEVRNATTIIVAQEALFDPKKGWTLRNGYARLLLGRGNESSFHFESLQTPAFDETPDKLLAVPKEPEEMGYRELGEFIEAIERSGGSSAELAVDRAQKLALPIATLIIILFAAPLANQAPRGGAAYGVGISLAVTIFYLMLFKVAGAAGESGVMPAVVAAWLPNGIFAVAAAGLLARVRT